MTSLVFQIDINFYIFPKDIFVIQSWSFSEKVEVQPVKDEILESGILAINEVLVSALVANIALVHPESHTVHHQMIKLITMLLLVQKFSFIQLQFLSLYISYNSYNLSKLLKILYLIF